LSYKVHQFSSVLGDITTTAQPLIISETVEKGSAF
jgi:hypothetical protein